MEWAEELFTLKKSAKKGRRAAAAAATAAATDAHGGSGGSSSAGSSGEKAGVAEKPGSGTSITSIANSLEATDLNAALRPPRRTSGWAEESTKSSSGKTGISVNVIEQERFGRSVPVMFSVTQTTATSNYNSANTTTVDLAVDDIPIIPDLDDLVDLDYSPTGAQLSHLSGPATTTNVDLEAPAVAVKRVAAYQALNSDLLKLGAFASLDGVDLSILTRCLVDESDLVEPDEVWTWDALFTEVSGDMHGDTSPDHDGDDHAAAEKRRLVVGGTATGGNRLDTAFVN